MAEDDPTPEELRALQVQLASLSVEQFLVSAASTLAALGTAKLEAKDLPEAKRAIDALASVVAHLEGEFAPELRQALTTLQVAFAAAASA